MKILSILLTCIGLASANEAIVNLKEGNQQVRMQVKNNIPLKLAGKTHYAKLAGVNSAQGLGCFASKCYAVLSTTVELIPVVFSSGHVWGKKEQSELRGLSLVSNQFVPGKKYPRNKQVVIDPVKTINFKLGGNSRKLEKQVRNALFFAAAPNAQAEFHMQARDLAQKTMKVSVLNKGTNKTTYNVNGAEVEVHRDDSIETVLSKLFNVDLSNEALFDPKWSLKRRGKQIFFELKGKNMALYIDTNKSVLPFGLVGLKTEDLHVWPKVKKSTPKQYDEVVKDIIGGKDGPLLVTREKTQAEAKDTAARKLASALNRLLKAKSLQEVRDLSDEVIDWENTPFVRAYEQDQKDFDNSLKMHKKRETVFTAQEQAIIEQRRNALAARKARIEELKVDVPVELYYASQLSTKRSVSEQEVSDRLKAVPETDRFILTGNLFEDTGEGVGEEYALTIDSESKMAITFQ